MSARADYDTVSFSCRCIVWIATGEKVCYTVVADSVQQLPKIPGFFGILLHSRVVEHEVVGHREQGCGIRCASLCVQILVADHTITLSLDARDLDPAKCDLIKTGPSRETLDWKLWPRHPERVVLL